MAMLTLNGQIINVFDTPDGTRKDGTAYGGQHRIQVMAENMLQNGEKRIELVNLTVESISKFKSLVGQMVRIPVGVFARDGSVQYYMLKGADIEQDKAHSSPRI